MLAVVIPVYNEGGNILKTLDSLYGNVRSEKKVYLVYDFPEDSTLPPVNNNLNKYPGLELMPNKFGRGVLNAIKTGLQGTKEEAVLVTMADGSDEYDKVDLMYQKIEEGFGIVVGSRYMKGGRQEGGPFLKRFLSRLAGVSLFYLARIPTHDISNSFRMYSRKVLNDIKIESTGGFELGMEITVKAHLLGHKIAEIPTTWHDRAEGKSNFKLSAWVPHYLHWYCYLLKNNFIG